MCKTLTPTEQQQAYRRCLGKFPTGVAVVTARDGKGGLIGMTINSLCSISLTPALIGWCLDRRSRSYRAFANCSEFAVSVLAENQLDIARRFATRGADKFADIEDDGVSCPTITGASASFECRLYNTVLLGDHLMLVGRVNGFDLSNDRPLLYAENSFQTLATGAQAA